MDENEMDELKLVALTGNTKIPLKEAKELALYTANQMREVEGIITKAPLKIRNVQVIKKRIKKDYIKTKGQKEQKTDMYLLNFENNQGYVLTSGDRRVPGVFAYNSVGNLGDTIYNPGQNILLERIMYYMEKKKEEFNKNRLKLAILAQEELFKKLSKKQQQELIKKGLFDEKGKRIIAKIVRNDCFDLPNGNNNVEYEEPPRYSYGSWETVYKKAPLVKTLWGQSGLYNNDVDRYCSGGSDKEAPVGCVAVAVGQIIANHKKPTSFKGKYMNWNDMTHINSGDMFSKIDYCNIKGRADIQHLLAKLGDKDLLDMDYGCNGSGASTDDAVNTFHKLGYTATKQDYNSDKIISEIKNNRPVYIRGNDIRKWIDTPWWEFWTRDHYEYKGGHAWVLDGYVERFRKVTVTRRNNDCIRPDELSNPYTTHTYNQNLELVHNNFGWGGDEKGGNNIQYYGSPKGSKTGWYYKGLFDSNNNCDAPSNAYKSGISGNYQYRNQIITNIH